MLPFKYVFLSTTIVLEYAVKDVVEGAEYEFRVSAINVSGAGEFSLPSVMVTAKNPNSKSLQIHLYAVCRSKRCQPALNLTCC